MPDTTDPSNLSPQIEYIGASINPQSGVGQDFTNPVIYTVTALDDSYAEYTVTVQLVAQGMDNALLSNLSINPGNLDPSFDQEEFIYVGNIDSNVSSVEITAVAEDPNATVRIFPAIDLDGSLAQRTANVVVISADETNNNVYSIVFEKPNSINSESTKPNSKVYPNPTTGNLNIELNENLYGTIIKIHNGFGQPIDEFKIKKGKTQAEYDLSQYANGTYYILLFNQEHSDAHRIIKSK
jgi:hypothetical protein